MNVVMQRYTKISLFNLLLVAAMGVILRYKIAFSLPFIDQKHILHAHSHFAFAGWVTHALMILLVQYIAVKNDTAVLNKYKWIIYANLVTAYGMLLSFPWQGYGLASIFFSTASIIISYVFAVLYWKDLGRLPHKNISHWWMKAALLFNTLSSLGAFSLAFMMATKTVHQNWYLAAVYFFLHFQYNGWFFFACMGLATARLFRQVPLVLQKTMFWLFAAACIPAYVLSALWLPVPSWGYVIVVFAAFAQVAGWWFIVQQIKQQAPFINTIVPGNIRWIFLLSAVALTIKLWLQLGSTIPSLSNMAFGFRPIVIGYLHLILLGFISLFIIGYMMLEKNIRLNPAAARAIKVFVAGVIINEFFLMVQGIAAMTFTALPYINELLLGAALLLFTGIGMLNFSQRSTN